MGVGTASGARLFIGSPSQVVFPVPDSPLSDIQVTALIAEFVQDSYIEVGEIEDMGEIGDEAETITFTSLQDGRVRKFKGPRDAGTTAIVVGRDITDEGQAAMEAAEGQTFDYNIKIELNDAITLGGDNTVQYFRAKVGSKRQNIGNASNIVRKTFNLLINSSIVEEAAT